MYIHVQTSLFIYPTVGIISAKKSDLNFPIVIRSRALNAESFLVSIGAGDFSVFFFFTLRSICGLGVVIHENGDDPRKVNTFKIIFFG